MGSEDTLEVRIGGMSCGGCVRGVVRAFEKAGLAATDVQVGRATLKGSPAIDAVRAALEGAGFRLLGVEHG
jgi:copper chaperone CopZ